MSTRKTASAERDVVVVVRLKAAARFGQRLLGSGEITEVVPAVIGSNVAGAGASYSSGCQVGASLAMHAHGIESSSHTRSTTCVEAYPISLADRRPNW